MTLKEWNSNPNIIWKAAVQHYPIWFVSSSEIAFTTIDDIFLPLLRQYKFDFHINGHEHLFSYSYLDNNTPTMTSPKRLRQSPVCAYDAQYWFGDTSQSRETKMKQGQALHQITTGATGKIDYDICYDQSSNIPHWVYAQNIYNAWS